MTEYDFEYLNPLSNTKVYLGYSYAAFDWMQNIV